MDKRSILLLCTVGGTPAPVVTAIKRLRPARVRFVHSPQTKGDIEEKIVPKLRDDGVEFDSGRYDFHELADAQDINRCLDSLRSLTQFVTEWCERGPSYEVVVDITGGTKCMSAALAIQGTWWPCSFSYVGGTERTKGNTGTVEPGTEILVQRVNPRDVLAHHAVDDFIVLFDRHDYMAAATVALNAVRRRETQMDRRREITVLEQLARLFDAWDRFDLGGIRKPLENVSKSQNDLRAALGPGAGNRVIDELDRLARHFRELDTTSPPSQHHVVDLLANAKRRVEEGRFDDAVGRIYRAIEAIAQVALKERHGMESTEKVPLERVPEPLRGQWAPYADEGLLKLGLQDSYALLQALGDRVGVRFEEERLSGKESPLVARNRSILAHGFERVTEKTAKRLWASALKLAGVDANDLPSFPKLAGKVEKA